MVCFLWGRNLFKKLALYSWPEIVFRMRKAARHWSGRFASPWNIAVSKSAVSPPPPPRPAHVHNQLFFYLAVW
jgi:hypothetical protein